MLEHCCKQRVQLWVRSVPDLRAGLLCIMLLCPCAPATLPYPAAFASMLHLSSGGCCWSHAHSRSAPCTGSRKRASCNLPCACHSHHSPCQPANASAQAAALEGAADATWPGACWWAPQHPTAPDTPHHSAPSTPFASCFESHCSSFVLSEKIFENRHFEVACLSGACVLCSCKRCANQSDLHARPVQCRLLTELETK